MSGEMASLAADLTPYVSAAVGAYGGAVLAKVRDDAADATVGLGRRLLQRVFGSRREGEPPPEPLAALIADPDDNDALAAVRLAIRRALADDPGLQAEARSMLATAPVAQQVHARRDAYTAGRDQTVINYSASGGPKSYQDKRREAYEGLWEVVQTAHLRMRRSLTEGFSDGISAFLVEVTSFGWKKGIYIDEADQELAQEYLFMVYEFLRLVVQHEVAKDWVATTAALPRGVPRTLRAMQVAENKADELRAQLAGRVRAVLAGLPDQPTGQRQSTGDVTAAHFAELLRRHDDDSVEW
jgi:hypothetical protein